jgi:magnesium transporter
VLQGEEEPILFLPSNEEEVHNLIAARNFLGLRRKLRDFQPPDLALLISHVPIEEQVVVFRLLPYQIAADTFEYLEIESQKSLLRAMGQEDVVKILNEMSADDRTAMLEELPSSAVTQLLRLLTPEERKIAQALLNYPENSVGRLMTPDFLLIQDDWTVQQVLDHIRAEGQSCETLNVLYVVDSKRKLIDDVRIREFLLRPLDAKVSDIRDKNFVALHVSDDQEHAVSIFRKYDRNVLPVVDTGGVLVGIVTIDDILDVEEEETTEDIQKLGAVEALDQSYMSIPLLVMTRKRATWLVVLFLGEMLTASAMSFFEDEIAKAVVLALFVPLIISSGGNAGSQATTLMIRALALGEVSISNWWQIMRREIVAGLILGLLLGSIGFLRIVIWSSFTPIYGPHWFLIGVTVGLALVGVVLWGSLAGSMLPLILKRLRLDPATSSAPFVATLVDVTGLVLYFTIALILLKGTLL